MILLFARKRAKEQDSYANERVRYSLYTNWRGVSRLAPRHNFSEKRDIQDEDDSSQIVESNFIAIGKSMEDSHG